MWRKHKCSSLNMWESKPRCADYLSPSTPHLWGTKAHSCIFLPPFLCSLSSPVGMTSTLSSLSNSHTPVQLRWDANPPSLPTTWTPARFSVWHPQMLHTCVQISTSGCASCVVQPHNPVARVLPYLRYANLGWAGSRLSHCHYSSVALTHTHTRTHTQQGVGAARHPSPPGKKQSTLLVVYWGIEAFKCSHLSSFTHSGAVKVSRKSQRVYE